MLCIYIGFRDISLHLYQSFYTYMLICVFYPARWTVKPQETKKNFFLQLCTWVFQQSHISPYYVLQFSLDPVCLKCNNKFRICSSLIRSIFDVLSAAAVFKLKIIGHFSKILEYQPLFLRNLYIDLNRSFFLQPNNSVDVKICNIICSTRNL